MLLKHIDIYGKFQKFPILHINKYFLRKKHSLKYLSYKTLMSYPQAWQQPTSNTRDSRKILNYNILCRLSVAFTLSTTPIPIPKYLPL